MDRDDSDYITYSCMALYVAGGGYFLISCLYLLYFTGNKCCDNKQNTPKRPLVESSTSATITTPKVAPDRAKSAASKTMQVIVTVPSLANSSVITQGTLESLVPKLMHSATSVSSSATNSPPSTKVKMISKSLKIAEYRPSDVAGKLSTVSIK